MGNRFQFGSIFQVHSWPVPGIRADGIKECGIKPYGIKQHMTYQRRPLRAMDSFCTVCVLACLPLAAFAQDSAAPSHPASQTPANNTQAQADSSSTTPAQEQEPPGGKRIFGVLPNYRTADRSLENTTLSAKQKFTIASKDSFDYPLILLSGALAGIGQLTNENPSFGQGVEGYAHRLATNYADQAMGNLFTEGLFPAMLHEDPRYFRRGSDYGSPMKRAGYAISRVFVTKKDSGGTTFNYAEWLGNASAVAISNTYYPDSRTASENTEKLVQQVGIDALSQVLKEFWPDIKHKLFHKGSTPAD